jgi:hypothetical protein
MLSAAWISTAAPTAGITVTFHPFRTLDQARDRPIALRSPLTANAGGYWFFGKWHGP